MCQKGCKTFSLMSELFTYYASSGDFIEQSVTFNDEMPRFKREQTHEIVHSSCLNVNGSMWL